MVDLVLVNIHTRHIAMFQEDELLPISALQHLMFCERQWALIHLEQQWLDNKLTAEGNLLHAKAHDPSTEVRDGLRITRGLRLRSLRLGLTGQADVVEFIRIDGSDPNICMAAGAVRLADLEGLWRPVPVEYKRGRDKVSDCDRVQVCAQALCLEEMLQTSLSVGAIFYGEPRKRLEIELNACLRATTEAAALRLHELDRNRKTPPAVWKSACKRCSLIELCMPRFTQAEASMGRYMDVLEKAAEGDWRAP